MGIRGNREIYKRVLYTLKKYLPIFSKNSIFFIIKNYHLFDIYLGILHPHLLLPPPGSHLREDATIYPAIWAETCTSFGASQPPSLSFLPPVSQICHFLLLPHLILLPSSSSLPSSVHLQDAARKFLLKYKPCPSPAQSVPWLSSALGERIQASYLI